MPVDEINGVFTGLGTLESWMDITQFISFGRTFIGSKVAYGFLSG